jgi:meso-butanediol dehydrogenase/(S,S)-butanediol dehydrogenase/diacetyl reductase
VSDTKTALVTGAGSGIGREIARLLATEGWALALVGRRIASLHETREQLGIGDRCVVLPGDVAETSQAKGLISRAVEALGGLGGLVNNAGYAPLTPIADCDEAEAERIFRVNTLGPLALIRAAMPHLLAEHGVIVNVSSVAAFDPFPGLSVYGAAKAGLNTLTTGLATEYGDRGLSAFAVAPGAVETAMLRSIVSTDDLPASAALPPEAVARVVVDCVLGKLKEPNGSTIRVPSP